LLILILIILFAYSKKIKPSFLLPSNSINLFVKNLKILLISFLILFIVVLPLNISLVQDKIVSKNQTLNIQIIFDVSLSMTANDIKPSRFD